VYRSPNTASEFWDRFETCLDQAFDLCNNIIIVGDINENQLNPSNHKFKDILCLNNLSNVINEPTRVTDCSSTLIDPIAITNTLQHLHSGIFETDKSISDHFGTYIYIDIDLPKNAPYKRKIWRYQYANFRELNAAITSYDWSYLHTGDLNQIVLSFTNVFLQ